jgi:hypothetical protein
MTNESHPPAGGRTVLAARSSAEDLAAPSSAEDLAAPSSAEDDASISWLREPADGEEPDGDAAVDGVAAESTARLWSDTGAQAFRARWREVQLRFVDDPPAAVREAEALVTDATDEFATIIAAKRAELAGSRSGEGGDTEELRIAIRRYREFLDRVLDL